MPQLPAAFIESLRGAKGFDATTFLKAHMAAHPVTSIRINPAKWNGQNECTEILNGLQHRVPWAAHGYYLQQRPSFTFDPQFHAGAYYVQEASSLFVEQALLQTTDVAQPLKVLDLCAAPGGKSTHLQSLLHPESLLVSNEVIRSRAAVLKQNIIKWGAANVVVTSADPQQFARLEAFFDVMLIDAPCSGSGLFRRDADAIAEWSLQNVQLCCGRQKRIIADALPALKKEGLLIYSTCSYSPEENEAVCDWMQENFDLENIPLQMDEAWNIIETTSLKSAKGYRFYPDKLKGEGFFLAVFRKRDGADHHTIKAALPEQAIRKEIDILKKWVHTDNLNFFKSPYLHALPQALAQDYGVLKKLLPVVYAGVAIGEVMHDKLVPEHALALSGTLHNDVPVTNVDCATAIAYLQRKEIKIDNAVKGWQVLACGGQRIGWANALPNRINNYYPKEWRILKEAARF